MLPSNHSLCRFFFSKHRIIKQNLLSMHHSSDLLLQVCWENTEWFTLIFHQAIEKSNCQWSRRPTCVCVCVHWWSGPRWAALGLNLGVSCRHDNIVLSLMREQINIQISLMNKREVTSESDLKHSSRKRPTSDCWHKWIQHSPDLYSFVFAFWHLLIFVCFFQMTARQRPAAWRWPTASPPWSRGSRCRRTRSSSSNLLWPT